MSYIITVKGQAKTEYKDLKALHGISCSDCFSDYLDDALKSRGIKGGYMHFEYNPDEKKLYTITEYEAEQLLSEPELERLKDYTQGQWADGIGEGFEQYPCQVINGEEIYLSPWFYKQPATITQEIDKPKTQKKW